MAKVLITGGAGFIGANTAARFMKDGHEVHVIDNLSRRGTTLNLEWLHAEGLRHFHQGDLRDTDFVEGWFRDNSDVEAVIHLAGQVAVTTSITDPRSDFEHNLLASFNVLEAVRMFAPEAALLYSSTNKVYGGLEEYDRELDGKRYKLPQFPRGISEEVPLDFHSPYGCSKGAVDQYVRDYHRIYGMNTVVFRQSCIYGTRQMGVEDQGWVAWFLIAGMLGKEITLYGDGYQVRDLLYVDDLIELYRLTLANIRKVAGRIYNVGGGADNAISLVEFLIKTQAELGLEISFTKAEWRPGDQAVFIADTDLARRDLGWRPRTSLSEGLRKTYTWIQDHAAALRGMQQR